MSSQPGISFRLLPSGEWDVIRPLWEQLNAHHARYPTPFAEEIAANTFDARLRTLWAKEADGRLRVEIASATSGGPPVGYCVTSLSSTGMGEVDSLFVSPANRRARIASTLLQHALNWLCEGGAVRQSVVVLHANEEAMAFYRQFGFYPRNIELERDLRSHGDLARPNVETFGNATLFL